MAAEFCVCGSLKVKGNCTNKKCKYHIRGLEPATFKQICYIKELLKKLNDKAEYDFKNMTMKEADELIKTLEERLELGDE